MFCIAIVAFIGVSRDSHSKIFAENIAEWKPGTDYKEDDKVTYNEDSFYALQDHKSNEENSPGINEGGDYWEYIDDDELNNGSNGEPGNSEPGNGDPAARYDSPVLLFSEPNYGGKFFALKRPQRLLNFEEVGFTPKSIMINHDVKYFNKGQTTHPSYQVEFFDGENFEGKSIGEIDVSSKELDKNIAENMKSLRFITDKYFTTSELDDEWKDQNFFIASEPNYQGYRTPIEEKGVYDTDLNPIYSIHSNGYFVAKLYDDISDKGNAKEIY